MEKIFIFFYDVIFFDRYFILENILAKILVFLYHIRVHIYLKITILGETIVNVENRYKKIKSSRFEN